MSDQEMMEVALLENIQREDLNVIEEARAYQQMIRSLNYTQDQLAHRIGKSRSTLPIRCGCCGCRRMCSSMPSARNCPWDTYGRCCL